MTIDQAIQLALQHHNAGQLQQAEQIYRQILQQSPEHPEALHLLGVLALQVGRADAAADLIGKAVAGDPQALYYSNLCEALRRVGRLDDAEAAARSAIQSSPQMAVAHVNLGTILLDQQRVNEAEAALRRAVELSPRMANALTMLGNVLMEKNDLDGAIEHGRRAIAADPTLPAAHNNLATALERRGDLEAAEESYRRAIALDERFVEALTNLGSLLRKLGRMNGAVECWNRALTIRPSNPDAQWNLALATLALGDFEHGWPIYESRFACAHSRRYWREYPVPRWQGESISGRTILLHAEQGLGDTIQFARFIPILADRGATVVLECQDALVELMKTVPGIGKVIATGQSPPTFDTHLQLMSIPAVLHTRLDTIPARVPYLFADESRAQQWAQRAANIQGLKVGLVWAGRPAHEDDSIRSMPLEMLAPLGQLQNVTFFSLQMGPARDQIASLAHTLPLIDLADDLHDFGDTAAAIQSLDLLISVDTAPAHLAGAMGKPVWTLLATAPDFRWMYDRTDTPWYPTMRLFRQTRRGDWSEVVAAVVEQLRAFRRG
jgi:tetratricopeptide (TPR) repeat protein